MSQNDVQDSLKSFTDIHNPDKRSVFRIEDVHFVLNQITLIEAVPAEVRQLFETAKNLSLYSWFVYRFHQPSELISFSALEMALRIRFKRENPEKRAPTLGGLLRHASSHKWVENNRFPNRFENAFRNAEHRKFIELIQSEALRNGEEVPVPAPTESDIQKALEELDEVGGILKSVHKLRNDLAHGSDTLHPGSFITLRRTSELINQTFSGLRDICDD